MTNPSWLEWAQRLQAIAQTGLTYTSNHFDVERFEAIREIAAEMMASGAKLPSADPIVELFKHDTGYATPKIDVRAAVFHDNKILLVRELEDGKWSLPGGFADVGTPPSLNVIREVKEESGYDAEIIKLAAFYDRNLHGHPYYPFHAYKIFFTCRLTGGNAVRSTETDGAEFFPENHLPELSLIRVTEKQIQHMFDHYRHPDWPTSFD